MKVSVTRIEGFSDGLIAIIITLMVLEIPLPDTLSKVELLDFFKSILIYCASFIVVGAQWNRHHLLFDEIKEVSNSFVWKNLIYLLSLSLIPLFMKWLIQFPFNIIPALGYAIVYLLNDFGIRVLFLTLLKENKKENIIRKIGQGREKLSLLHMFIFILYLIAIFALSTILPEISIICFIVFPVIMSLSNLFISDRHRRNIRLDI